MKKTKYLVVLALLFLGVIFVNINYLVSYFNPKIDMTEGNIYTLSDNSKEILNSMPNPVVIRFYEDEVPIQLRSYSKKIKNLLQEYSRQNSNVIMKELDPEPATDAKVSASIDGLKPYKLKNGKQCYLGVTVSSLDNNKTLSFIPPNEVKTLEYKLTKAIYDVTHPQKKNVGIISSLPVMGGYKGVLKSKSNKKLPWIFVQKLKKSFNVKKLDYETKTIDPDIDILLLINPVNLSFQTKYAIDQYLLQGGRIIAFLDPYCITEMMVKMRSVRYGKKPEPNSSSLPRLLDNWGIKFSESKNVVLDPENTYSSDRTPFKKEHPAILEFKADSMSDKSVITAGLNKLNFVFSGAFEYSKNNNLDITELVTTSQESKIYNNFDFRTRSFSFDEDSSKGKEQNIALKLRGKFSSAFNEKELEDKEIKKRTHIRKAGEKGTVLLLGDADMLFNSFCVAQEQHKGQTITKPINNNLSFIQNAVDQLSGNQEIIEIRAAKSQRRTFKRFEQIRDNIKKKYKEKIEKLKAELRETEQYINNLKQENFNQDEEDFLNSDQLQALREFRLKEKQTKKELRSLKQELRSRISFLRQSIKILNIFLIPGLVILLGIIVYFVRKKKSRKKYSNE